MGLGGGGEGERKIWEMETINSGGGDRMVCEMVRGIQKGEGRMIEYRRGR